MKNILFVLILPIFWVDANAQTIDTIKVKVHDHVMTLYSSGVGKPTVILEAGGGSNHRTWQLVQPKLANSVRAISYDRPGYLNSDTCTAPRDAITIAKELKEALIKANILPERDQEIEAISHVLQEIDKSQIISLPKDAHVEGGDVMLHNDYLFIGAYYGSDYPDFITARTNLHTVIP